MLESFNAEVGASPANSDDLFFQRAARDLTFQLQIPRAKLAELGKSGPAATTLSDQRRHVRFHQLKRCIVRCSGTYSVLARSPQPALGLITNVSKDGIGFLFHTQLFPNERFVLRVEGSGIGIISLTVARCRKLGPQCYAIGAESSKPIDIKQFMGT